MSTEDIQAQYRAACDALTDAVETRDAAAAGLRRAQREMEQRKKRVDDLGEALLCLLRRQQSISANG